MLTDVYETALATSDAEESDMVQLPDFLARQTDLVAGLADTDSIINIKKPQFIAHHEVGHILHKCEEAGNNQLIICERGSSFGYNNLVVDMLGFGIMKAFGYPVF